VIDKCEEIKLLQEYLNKNKYSKSNSSIDSFCYSFDEYLGKSNIRNKELIVGALLVYLKSFKSAGLIRDFFPKELNSDMLLCNGFEEFLTQGNFSQNDFDNAYEEWFLDMVNL
jgi:hypothetical protein